MSFGDRMSMLKDTGLPRNLLVPVSKPARCLAPIAPNFTVNKNLKDIADTEAFLKPSLSRSYPPSRSLMKTHNLVVKPLSQE